MLPRRGKQLNKIIAYCLVQPLKRPRLNKHTKNVYQPKDNQILLYHELLNLKEFHTYEMIHEQVLIDMVVEFARGKPGNSPFRSEFPTQPIFGDEDNLRKAINDALVATKILHDDRLVVGGSTYKIFGKRPKVTIKIWSIDAKPKRKKPDTS